MDDCCAGKAKTIETLARGDQRRVLVLVMILNAVLFVAELGFGLVARSSAMMADSVDMLGDAIVYALSLYALSRGDRWHAGAALAKAGLILAFGAAILVETALKIVGGVTPSSTIMLAVTAIALVGNLTCLALLWRFRGLNVNMASTFECSRNDVLANLGVLAAGGLVGWFGTGWPDVLVGLIIAILFLRSAVRVVGSAWPVWRGGSHA
ncbi:MAG TPA: cation transporter, partial [Caulobacteraceae bacterium]|nr:cation transporter [Caulobacteraceae bacterium]